MIPFLIAGLSWARRLGRWLGLLAYYCLPIRKSVVKKNLQIVFPEWDEPRLRRGIREAYEGAGLAVADFAYGHRFNYRNVYRYVRFEGWQHYEAAHQSGRSVLLYCTHQAMWEWGVVFPAFSGRPLYVVMKRIHHRFLDAYVKRRRTKFGVTAVDQRGAVAALDGHRNAGADYVMLIDQRAAKGKGVWIQLFGRPVAAMPGAAVLALRGRLPLVPASFERTREGLTIRFYEPLRFVPTGDWQADVQALTQMMHKPSEAWIRLHPESYFWFHDRFKVHTGEEPGAGLTPQAGV